MEEMSTKLYWGYKKRWARLGKTASMKARELEGRTEGRERMKEWMDRRQYYRNRRREGKEERRAILSDQSWEDWKQVSHVLKQEIREAQVWDKENREEEHRYDMRVRETYARNLLWIEYWGAGAILKRKQGQKVSNEGGNECMVREAMNGFRSGLEEWKGLEEGRQAEWRVETANNGLAWEMRRLKKIWEEWDNRRAEWEDWLEHEEKEQKDIEEQEVRKDWSNLAGWWRQELIGMGWEKMCMDQMEINMGKSTPAPRTSAATKPGASSSGESSK